MKKLILMLVAVSMATGVITTASAGEKEWATAGKILAGVTAYQFLSGNLLPQQRAYYGYSYYAPRRSRHYYQTPRHYSPRRYRSSNTYYVPYSPRRHRSSNTYYVPSYTTYTTTYAANYSEPVVIVEENNRWW